MSIIIPAFDEEPLIGACLRSVVAQDYDGPIQVIVVANGCTDATAAVARSWKVAARARGCALDVIELAPLGKPAALRAGDRAAGGQVRVFLDADTRLSSNAVAAMVLTLAPGTGVLHCAPRIVARLPRQPVVRSYVRLWRGLPYVTQQAIGAGCYAVNRDGRRRFGQFPDLVSDDKFVRLHFRSCESQVVTEADFTVRFPESFSEMVRIRGRWSRGSRDVARLLPHLRANDLPRWGDGIAHVVRRPRGWRDVPAFCLIFALGQVHSLLHRGAGIARWERARTARTASFEPSLR